jgi:protein-disulfide isomerase
MLGRPLQRRPASRFRQSVDRPSGNPRSGGGAVSRGYNARRKAKRQQARAAAEPPQRQTPKDLRRATLLLPALAIAAILIATAILGFGAGSSSSPKQIHQEVDALLAGIPQHGAILGSPDAKTTLTMFVDLECPTVKRFVESYLPAFISTWVRPGLVKLAYRSLKTDTANDRTFFRQEEAAWAASRQNKMWNFALSFIRQQGQRYTEYATDTFVAHIASQVPGLDMKRWNLDRKDPSLFRTVALSVGAAHGQGLRFTPSFTMTGTPDTATVRGEVRSSLEKDLQVLTAESSGDVPTLKIS